LAQRLKNNGKKDHHQRRRYRRAYLPGYCYCQCFKKLDPATEILFVGASGRMEMEKVPAAGYKIIGLDIQGIQRKSIWKNVMFPVKLLNSVRKGCKL
jgi:UDP-N-acetylglucosamine--N-acetylmuramyl-(pentapeptide) pyrophosphoryl-undecaprenol N-acetylglucosamine transferase